MLRRHLDTPLARALGEFPAVTLLGGRQVGKTTLARSLASGRWPAGYVTLDDRAVLDAALRDPDGFVDGLALPVVLDEVQRAPDLLRSVKRAVDRNRRPGMFLITGSANLLTMKSVSESLAGRAAVFELCPFSWAELHRAAPPATVEALFSCRTARAFLEALPAQSTRVPRNQVVRRMLAGGYPVPALMSGGAARSQWLESYRQTYLERDVRDLASVASLPDFGRLLTAAALRTGQLLNTAEISRDLGISHNTVRRHLGLLEVTYQAATVRPYFANVGKRLVKTPKLYFNDTGMAAHLMVAGDWATLERQGRAGALVETWAASELRKLLALAEKRTELLFWRTHAGREVDFILARGDRLAAVEVKWAQKIDARDIAGLQGCREDLKESLGLAVVLYAGSQALALDNRTVAVPLPLFFGA